MHFLDVEVRRAWPARPRTGRADAPSAPAADSRASAGPAAASFSTSLICEVSGPLRFGRALPSDIDAASDASRAATSTSKRSTIAAAQRLSDPQIERVGQFAAEPRMHESGPPIAVMVLAYSTMRAMQGSLISAVVLPASAVSTAGSALSRARPRPPPAQRRGRCATSTRCANVASVISRISASSFSSGLAAMTGRATSISSLARVSIRRRGAHSARASRSARRARMSRSASVTRARNTASISAAAWAAASVSAPASQMSTSRASNRSRSPGSRLRASVSNGLASTRNPRASSVPGSRANSDRGRLRTDLGVIQFSRPRLTRSARRSSLRANRISDRETGSMADGSMAGSVR